MSDQQQNVIYKDIKKVLKWIAFSIIVFFIISFGWITIDVVKNNFDKQSREAEIFDKAIPFASSHTPWIYTRDDFGKESKLSLWFIGDTDQHAIIKVGEDYSVYSTTTDMHGSINFHHVAGEICSYASAYLNDGMVAGVQCEKKSYSGGPWNKFR